LGKLLWLASFPKSGNTWVRAFLANYLANSETPVDINTLPTFALGDMRVEPFVSLSGRPAAELSPEDIDRLRPAVQRGMAAAQRGIAFIKTHNLVSTPQGVPLIAAEATFAAIYIVRNPLDVAVSFADHYGMTPADAARAICFPGLVIEPREGQIKQYVSDWSSHVQSWRGAVGFRVHCVRYEDLSRAPLSSFGEIVAFLGLKPDHERLGRAVRHASFRVLARQEKEKGFAERSRHAKRFFRAGTVGGWRRVLRSAEVEMIVRHHGPTMLSLGYIDGEGRPKV
jgi:hypothetical protein